jgi:hypothetical protein
VIDIRKWGRNYRCYLCQQARGRATVRVFSGTYGGGYPTCDEHLDKTITVAMEPLQNPRIPLNDGYTVRAYEVVEGDDGYPRMGRLLWSARRREAA